MARVYLPERGSKYAPCSEDCTHEDCAETRRQYVASCVVCEKGFEPGGAYYVMSSWFTEATPLERKMAHAECIEAREGVLRRAANPHVDLEGRAWDWVAQNLTPEQ